MQTQKHICEIDRIGNCLKLRSQLLEIYNKTHNLYRIVNTINERLNRTFTSGVTTYA